MTEKDEGFYLILCRFRCGDLRCCGGCDLLRLQQQKERQKENSWVSEKRKCTYFSLWKALLLLVSIHKNALLLLWIHKNAFVHYQFHYLLWPRYIKNSQNHMQIMSLAWNMRSCWIREKRNPVNTLSNTSALFQMQAKMYQMHSARCISNQM